MVCYTVNVQLQGQRVKVTRQTHSQIIVRIHFGRREERRPTKDISSLKKSHSFPLPNIYILRGLQSCSGYRLRVTTGLCQFLQPFGWNTTTGSNRAVLGRYIHLCCQKDCRYSTQIYPNTKVQLL